MSIALVTGSSGLIGSEVTRHFPNRGLTVVGIDNDVRFDYSGKEVPTLHQCNQPEKELGTDYHHVNGDAPRWNEAVTQ